MNLQKLIIKVYRYVLRIKYVKVFDGPLKGFLWSTSTNYDFLTGTYEDPETIKAFCSWLNNRTIFYDLGANAGYYSLIAATVISEGEIHAFEPMNSSREKFNQHLKKNAARIYPVIKLHPYAITSHRQQLTFSNADTEGASYIRKGTGKLEVQGVSLDELIEEGFPPPDVLKIDVEGAEFDVLTGSMNVLRRYRPRILLATHDSHLPGVKKKCIDLLQSLGYHLTYTGNYNKNHPGLDDYLAEYEQTEVTY